jgi:PhnB protein
MQLNAHLMFNGDCEEAFQAYARILGGKIEAMMPHEGTPAAEHVPLEWRKKILHARLSVDGQVVMGSDAPPTGQGTYEPPRGFSVSLQNNNPTETERIFQALSKNGQVRMPIQETFWAARFGMCVDRFGIPWMINCERAAQHAG